MRCLDRASASTRPWGCPVLQAACRRASAMRPAATHTVSDVPSQQQKLSPRQRRLAEKRRWVQLHTEMGRRPPASAAVLSRLEADHVLQSLPACRRSFTGTRSSSPRAMAPPLSGPARHVARQRSSRCHLLRRGPTALHPSLVLRRRRSKPERPARGPPSQGHRSLHRRPPETLRHRQQKLHQLRTPCSRPCRRRW